MPAASEVVIPIRAVDNTNKAFASVKKSLHSLQQSVFSVKSAVAGLTAAFSVGQMTKFLDTATRIENRLKLVTKSSEELVKAQQDVAAIAKITGQNYEQTANLYSRIIQSTEALNLSTKDQLTITQTVAKSLAITGESSESAAAAIKQLGQALASGVLRGEEFNSVSEQAPRVMKALQDSLGVSRGKLRELAKEGALTSEIVAEALLIQAETVDKEFGKTTRTVAQAYENLNTSAVKFFDTLDEKLQISDKYNSVINRMARGLDKVTESMKGATKIELKKQIEELTKAQQKELIELDALVMGNNSLNVMQQNQARILRLNIAERGKHIKELRAEYDELVNGKKATEKSSTATNENTESTKKSSEASKKLEERLAALRAKLNEKTESTKKATKSVADLSLEFEHAYTMGNVTALTYQGVKEANAALAAETIALSTAMEEAYTMGNLNAQAFQEVRDANEALIQKTIDLSVAMEQNYTMGNLNVETFKELAKQQEELAETTSNLSVAMERTYSMGNLNAQAFKDVKDANAALAEKTTVLSLAMEQTYTMANLNRDAFAEVRDINREATDSMVDLSVAMERTYTMGNLSAGAFRELAQQKKELAEQTSNLSVAMEEQLTMPNVTPQDFQKVEEINRLVAAQETVSGFEKSVEAGKERVRGVLGPIAAAGGAAGGRAMSVANAFAEKGLQGGVMQLVLSNKKVQEALSKVFEALFALIDPIIDLLAPVIETLVTVLDALKPLFQRLVPIIAKLLQPLMQLVKPLLILIDITIMQVEAIERLIKPLEELWEPLNKLTKVFETGAQRLIDALVQLPQKIFDALADALPDLGESFQIGGGQGLIPDNIPVLGMFKSGGMIPKAQNGMLVGGSHSMGGTIVAAEGGEYIFSREAVQRLGAGRLNQLNNGQDNGGVVVNIYDGTGQRISAYDSALRVEIKERAARNQQFAAVA